MYLSTAEQMYKATLYGVKKEQTSTIKPAAWNILINDAYTTWFNEKIKFFELDEKKIEDLRDYLKIDDNITPDPTPAYTFTVPADQHRVVKRLFKINYVDNVCGFEGVSEWLEAFLWRYDMKRTSYRRPSDEKLYYKIYQDKVELLTGTPSTPNLMRLEYIRKPDEIIFTTTIDQMGQLSEKNAREVVDIAIRIYLERAKDERYQSFLNEEAIKVQFK